MTCWRGRIGEKGAEKLLQATIAAGKATGTIRGKSFEKVIVDTAVQPKVVQHPTDARLYRMVYGAMLRIAEAEGIRLRQSHRKLMERGFRKHGGHAKARQFKRALKVLRSLKTMVGWVQRDVERKLTDEGYARHRRALILSEFALTQSRKTKGKVYSLHRPEVERITGQVSAMTFVDKGYQGHGADPTRSSQVLISGARKLSKLLKRDLACPLQIEPS
ncbi:hypothetical protein [Geothrix sp. PMB-07]|uniref:hypothetical protein n=1 Tax=Geothrix sp. PMB-07 TaxID=3068640 RepID=UPI002741720E|nr:hypothetical protein [Geothrix sp. PMB-07]WLT31321.1 hypothetical protein Q9293_16510 [Geothrix sp. PMB-07]